VRLYHTPKSLDHEMGEGHVERPERVTAILEHLEAQPWGKQVRQGTPRPAKGDELVRCHTPEMIMATKRLWEAGGGPIDADTAVGKGTWEAALIAAGMTIDAARAVARGDERNAYCITRPPGHHATRGQAMGFCFFNNVALAAQRVLDLKSARRVAILDHDVHHGNGTQDIFWSSPEVLYVSVHQAPLYPGTGHLHEVGEGEGAGFNLNLPVKPGTGEQAYAQLLDEVVLPVAESFDPDVWLVSAGYDSHQWDLLGSLELRSPFFATILAKLAEVQPRMVVALEGGYHLEGVGRSAVSQMAWLTGREVPTWDEKPRDRDHDVRPLVKEARKVLEPYWTF
jgi:acetoin utilization deacetylase AcuC-like enzyme